MDADGHPTHSEPPSEGERSAADDAQQLEQLRALLFGHEQERIDAVEQHVQQLEVTAKDVGRVLPQAIQARSAADDQLSRALTPTVEDSIQTSVRRNPQTLSDAIFPIIGPAIRKSIRSALAGMIESFNRALEHSLSPRSFAWRLEARRTGRPFAEVVLLKTLVYRVEQVLLIHRETGVLLQHAVAPAVATEDADMVSGMLTAIEDFMSDSFHPEADAELRQVAFGDLVLLLATGPRAVLAAVVRGTPAARLRERLQQTIEQIHAEAGEDLVGFKGDTGPFEATRPLLEQCLGEEKRQPAKRGSSKRGWIAAILVLALIGWGAMTLGQRAAAQRRAENLLRTSIEREPGLVLISAQRDGDRWTVKGLRDPLARSPDKVLGEAGLDPGLITHSWEAYESGAPGLALEKARSLLDPPPTVVLSVQDDRLVASGRAPHAWVRSARERASTVAGISRLDESALRDADLQELLAAASLLSKVTLFFPPDSSEPELSQQQRAQLQQTLTALDEAARRTDLIVRVDITGVSDSSEPQGPELARQRAASVGALLRQLHASAAIVYSVEADGPLAAADDQGAIRRRVVLEARVPGQPPTPADQP